MHLDGGSGRGRERAEEGGGEGQGDRYITGTPCPTLGHRLTHSDRGCEGARVAFKISSPPRFKEWNQNTEWLRIPTCRDYPLVTISNKQQLNNLFSPPRRKCFGHLFVSSTAPEPLLTALSPTMPPSPNYPTLFRETQRVPSPFTPTSATPGPATSFSFET